MKRHTLYAIIGLAVTLLCWYIPGTEGMILRGIGGFTLGWNLVEIFKHGL